MEQDIASNTRSLFHYDHTDDTFVLRDEQDATALVEENKERYNTAPTGWDRFQNHVANIPMVVWNDLVRRGIAYDEKRFRAWLDDRDNMLFRTRPGRLSR
jgi:hypothetical protein